MASQDEEDRETGIAKRHGVGTPNSVISYWQDVFAEHEEIVQILQDLKGLITGMAVDDSGVRVLRSIAASIINQDFESSDILCHVDDDGKVTFVDYANNNQKNLIWIGMVTK